MAVGDDLPEWGGHHDWRYADVDLGAYAATGLPLQAMGREDPPFFRAALAGGTLLL
jgi:hypothetical protein